MGQANHMVKVRSIRCIQLLLEDTLFIFIKIPS